MEKVLHQELQDFTYSTEEERAAHVKEMVAAGWESASKVKRMKPGSSIWDSNKEENYEWYAQFWRYHQ